MYRVRNTLNAGSYTLLVLDHPIAERSSNKIVIEGVEYERVPVYGFPPDTAHVAIKAVGSFTGKTITVE